jgi:hypothetical protein
MYARCTHQWTSQGETSKTSLTSIKTEHILQEKSHNNNTSEHDLSIAYDQSQTLFAHPFGMVTMISSRSVNASVNFT